MKFLLLFILLQSIFHQTAQAQVSQVPEVLLQPTENITLQAGTSLTLTCNVTNYTQGNLEIQWIEPNGVVIDDINVTSSTNDTLTSMLVITDILTSQAGVYMCSVNLTEMFESLNTSQVVTQSTMVFVQIPPPEVILSLSREHPIYEGTPLSLVCTAVFNNTGVDTAISFDRQLFFSSTNDSSRRVVLTENQTANNVTVQLDIAPVGLSDTGKYTCVVEIQSTTEFIVTGKGEDSANLTVSGLPLPIVESSEPLNDFIGRSTSLTCVVTVVEHLIVQPTVVWVNSNGETVAGDGVTLLDANTYQVVLTFSQLLASQTGQYTCTATVDIPQVGVVNHTASDSVDLAAQIPPPMVCIATNQPAYHGTNHTLRCSVTIDPSVDVSVLLSFTWFAPSSNIPLTQDQFFSIYSEGDHSSLMLTPVREPNVSSGMYSCQVSVAAEDDTYIAPASGIDAVTVNTQAPLPPIASINVTRESPCTPATSMRCSGAIEVSLGVPLEYSWIDPTGQTVPQDTIHFTDIQANVTGLYTCQVCVSVDKVNLTDLCGLTNITIINRAPGPVSKMRCHSIGEQESLGVTWSPSITDNESVLGYLVEAMQYVQTKQGQSKVVTVEDLSPPISMQISALGALVSSLEPGVRYLLTVSAVGAYGCGPATHTDCYTEQQAPDIVRDIFVNRTSASMMNVSWVPLTVVEARGYLTMYNVYYTNNFDSNETNVNLKIVSPTLSSVIIDGLDEESNYGVQVEAQNSAGLRSNSDLSPRVFSGIFTPPSIDNTDNSSAITGGVIGAILIAALSIVTLVIAVLVYKFKSKRGNDFYDDQRSPSNTYANPAFMSPSIYDLPQLNHLHRDNCPQYEDIGLFQQRVPADYEVACSTFRRAENEAEKGPDENLEDGLSYENLLAIQESISSEELNSDTHT